MDPSAPFTTAVPPSAAQEPVREEDLFIAFDTYPWSKDPKFMNLIRTSLQKPSPDPEAKIRHARTAYFTRVLGFPLSPPSYAAYLSSHPEHTPPDATLLAVAQNPPDAPAWQAAAPKAELYVDKAAREAEGGGAGPAYPERFAELIRCIKEGKPVPGVREIPDTILRDPSAKPFGSRPAPRKPWEKDEAGPEVAGMAPVVDMEFPPLDPTASLDESKSTAGVPGEQPAVTEGAR